MLKHIHNSNLIEDIDDPEEDMQTMEAWAFAVGCDSMTMDNILEIHRLITCRQLSPKDAGHLRRANVMVGGRHCPALYLVRELLHNWILDMNHWQNLDPKDMHVRFEHIHPFIDGNGRTGRMLMWWHERKLGRKPMLIKFENRGEYYKWFESKRLNSLPVDK